jgi:hypothetical protein
MRCVFLTGYNSWQKIRPLAAFPVNGLYPGKRDSPGSRLQIDGLKVATLGLEDASYMTGD